MLLQLYTAFLLNSGAEHSCKVSSESQVLRLSSFHVSSSLSNEAKTVLESFNSSKVRPKEAILLEDRIKKCEYAAALATHAKTMNRPALETAVAEMQGCDLEMPLSIIGQIVERRVDEILAGLLCGTDGGKDAKSTKSISASTKGGAVQLSLAQQQKAAEALAGIFVISPANVLDTQNLLEFNFATLVHMTKDRHALAMRAVESEQEHALQDAHDNEWQVGITTCVEFNFSSYRLESSGIITIEVYRLVSC